MAVLHLCCTSVVPQAFILLTWLPTCRRHDRKLFFSEFEELCLLFFHATILAGDQPETLWQSRRHSINFDTLVVPTRAHYDTVNLLVPAGHLFPFWVQITDTPRIWTEKLSYPWPYYADKAALRWSTVGHLIDLHFQLIAVVGFGGLVPTQRRRRYIRAFETSQNYRTLGLILVSRCGKIIAGYSRRIQITTILGNFADKAEYARQAS